jgi:hypothetical protein
MFSRTHALILIPCSLAVVIERLDESNVESSIKTILKQCCHLRDIDCGLELQNELGCDFGMSIEAFSYPSSKRTDSTGEGEIANYKYNISP